MSCRWCGTMRHGESVLRLVQQAQLARFNDERILRERREHEARLRAEQQAIAARKARALELGRALETPKPETPVPETPVPLETKQKVDSWSLREAARAEVIQRGKSPEDLCASPWCGNLRPPKTTSRTSMYCCKKCKDDVARRRYAERQALKKS